MPARRLLYIDASGVTAHHWQLGHLHAEGSFGHDEAGLAAFADYLRRHRSSLFYLLADVAEEGFQTEDIPFVRGADRAALIERRLSQYFYGTPLSVALSLGRNKEGRRDEKVLFAALTRHQHFEPWLLALRHAESQLAGIFSMPLAIAALMRDTLAATPQALILSASRGGLRQTFFENGQLRFSRLTPMVTGSIDETAITAAVESEKMYQYLAGQRLITRGAPLAILVLAHPSRSEAFRSRCRDTDELRFRFVDLAAQAEQQGLKTPPGADNDANLYLHMLVRRTPRFQFAPAVERRFFRLWQARFALQSTAAVILVGCLLFAGKQLFDLGDLSAQTAEIQGQIDIDKRRYDAAMQTLPRIPLSSDHLRELTDRFEALARRSPGLEPMLLQLSQALATAPKVELTRLDWRLTGRPDDAPAGGTPAGADAGGPFVVLDVFARLPVGMVSDHRAQLETINGLAATLRSRPGLQVRVLKLPFEVESGKSLRSSGESAAQVEAPAFSLRVVGRP